jgi:peptidoglycan/LPS O-acetylase OafA/YrhL
LLRLEARIGSRTWSPLAKIGDASYVLYLSHPIFLSGAAWFCRRAQVDQAMALSAIAAALVASVVFSTAFHRWCERPMLDGLHRMLARRAR